MKTLEQILELFPDTKAEEWKRHSNGGGWIYSTATVAETAFVDEDAQVYDGAQVYDSAHVSGAAQVYGYALVFGTAQVSGDAQVYGDAEVYGDARVYGDAEVFGSAEVCGDAQVHGNAWVSGHAQVYGDAQMSGNAWVYGSSWKKSPPYIQGSRNSLTLSSFTEISIGCCCLPITYWKEHYKAIGRANHYTPEEIVEYGEYIELLSKAAERLTKESAMTEETNTLEA